MGAQSEEDRAEELRDYLLRHNRDPRFLARWAKRVAPWQKDPFYLSWLEMIPSELGMWCFPVLLAHG